MKDTAEESAELKQALKHDPETPQLREEAERHGLEAEEAVYEVLQGQDTVRPDSWVAREIHNDHV